MWRCLPGGTVMTSKSSKQQPLDSQQLLDALTALKNGQLSVLLPEDQPGVAGQIARVYNAYVQQMRELTAEANRIAREVREGMFGGQMEVPGASGAWQELMDNVNAMGEE